MNNITHMINIIIQCCIQHMNNATYVGCICGYMYYLQIKFVSNYTLLKCKINIF